MSSHYEAMLSWDLATLADNIENHHVDLVELTKAAFKRIHKVNSEFNAFVTLDMEEALRQAHLLQEELDRGQYRGPLHGVPFSIKDNILTQDIRTTFGSEIYKNYIPEEDALVVTQLKKAGAVILGKVNTHQFAYGTTGDRSCFGPTKNAVDPTLIAGGSSCGSAVSIAKNMCFGSLGTDTGGSIRIPSSFNGTVGMKPTFGLTSNNGVHPLAYTLDHVGPITRTVLDNAIILNIISLAHDTQLRIFPTEDIDFTEYIGKSIDGLRIGIPKTDFFTIYDYEVDRAYYQMIETLISLGAIIQSVNLLDMDTVREHFLMVMRCEAYCLHKDNVEKYAKEKWDEEVFDRILSGKNISATDYITSQHYKEKAMEYCVNFFNDIDLIVTPTIPSLPIKCNERYITYGSEKIHIRDVLNKFTGITNYLGLPSLSIPAGVSDKGLPIGIQLIGNYYEEAIIYQVAAALENANENK